MFQSIITGRLGHDNKLFNLTCATCKGLYLSSQQMNCPKCGKTLVPITASNNNRMMISEGRIYPIMTNGEKEYYEDARIRRNGLRPVYRFSIISFEDPNTKQLFPPRIHEYLTTGRTVTLTLCHPPIYKVFTDKNEELMVEVRLGLSKGDRIKLIDSKTSKRNMNMPGQYIPNSQTDQQRTQNNELSHVQQLEMRLNELKQELSNMKSPTPPPQPPQQYDVEMPIEMGGEDVGIDVNNLNNVVETVEIF